MSDSDFNGEKLTLTKVEFALVAALAVVVASMFVSIHAFVLLGVVLAVLGVVGVAWLAGGKPTQPTSD
jgi:hypothetical protein